MDVVSFEKDPVKQKINTYSWDLLIFTKPFTLRTFRSTVQNTYGLALPALIETNSWVDNAMQTCKPEIHFYFKSWSLMNAEFCTYTSFLNEFEFLRNLHYVKFSLFNKSVNIWTTVMQLISTLQCCRVHGVAESFSVIQRETIADSWKWIALIMQSKYYFQDRFA